MLLTNRNRALLISFLIAGCVLAGCKTTSKVGFDYEKSIARFVLENQQQGPVVTLPVSDVRIQISPTAVISEFDFIDVQVVELELGKSLLFTLTPSASRAFYKISVANQGKRMVLLLDGKPIGISRIQGPVNDGVIYAFLEVPESALEEIAINLKGTSIDIQNRLNR